MKPSLSRHPPCKPRPSALAQGVACALAVLVLGGCATTNLNEMREASKREPTNAKTQMDYLREREKEANAVLDEADRLREANQFDEAVLKLMVASKIDPTSERGRIIGAAIDRDRRDLVILLEAERMIKRGSYDNASASVDRVLAGNPANVQALRLYREIGEKRRLQRAAKEEKDAAASIMHKPVTLQFRDANVRMVFEALARTTGLNVIFDRDVRPDLKTTIFVTNAALDSTVDMILMQNQLDKKVMNADTLFIYPATPAKQQEYQDLKVRTFQLSNVDAKQIQALLKSLLKIKEVVIDERANSVSIRATPETIQVAERMIMAHDLPEPEVMLEVEVLEVSRDRMSDLGIDWPSSFTMGTPSSVGTWGALHHLHANDLNVSGLSATANFKLTDTDANLLASPRIRTRNKEKAKILIGDKVPVISSSSVPSTSGPAYSQSIQYLDVGIKLEVEPQVYRDNEVGIKMNLEVSNITQTISTSNSQSGLSSLAYQIGTRSASTSLRLKDGETQILGGLIQDEDRDAANKIPGLGQLPVLGRLFSNHNGDHKKTEIVLQITPHIVRGQMAADPDTREVWSGTDSNVRTEQLLLEPPAASTSGVPVVAVAPVTPGNVGGGGGDANAAASAKSAAPEAPAQAPAGGAFGVAPVAPRTTPPPSPYGGKFITTVPPPASAAGSAAVAPAAAPAAAPAPAPAEAADAGPGATVTPVAPPAATPATPVAPPAPPPILPAQPTDMPSENPLHAIPVESN
ncbi:general secretion pathway protein GspD [Pandoraea terrae]|uniref:General secretion pathway protein GspD n=1 Tax=Pandoraea terrae TaxID=1537710 RepID=A0A5E4SNH1_9BURK|nr:type IV pilus secretin PilQ [Pandoraea terrae]VVD77025.1 general secretion pathway protein GspD [Pandoraea terrae]